MLSPPPPKKKKKTKDKKRKRKNKTNKDKKEKNNTKLNTRAKNNNNKKGKKKRFEAYHSYVNSNLHQYLVREKGGRIKGFYCIVANSELKAGANAEIVFFLRSLALAVVLFKQTKPNLALAWV